MPDALHPTGRVGDIKILKVPGEREGKGRKTPRKIEI
jgi:hypothetical protein